MADVGRFFVSYVDEGHDEDAYETLTRLCGRQPAPRDRRIESIVFEHNAEEWTATVGEELRGTEVTKRRRKAGIVDVMERSSDRASVVAIFAGDPYLVFTNKNIYGIRSIWESLFMVGQPRTISYFDKTS